MVAEALARRRRWHAEADDGRCRGHDAAAKAAIPSGWPSTLRTLDEVSYEGITGVTDDIAAAEQMGCTLSRLATSN